MKAVFVVVVVFVFTKKIIRVFLVKLSIVHLYFDLNIIASMIKLISGYMSINQNSPFLAL